VQPYREVEDFLGALGELLGDAVGMPGRFERAAWGREDEPIRGKADQAQTYVSTRRSAGDDAEIICTHLRSQLDEKIIQRDLSPRIAIVPTCASPQ
jgi:hypothetical protein